MRFDFPLIEELPYFDPLILAALNSSGTIFLDSANTQTAQGRYSFVAFSPFQVMTCQSGFISLDGKTYTACPFTVLQNELDHFQLSLCEGLPPFQGGVAGMLGYELGGYLEKIPKAARDDFHFPDLIIGFYDLVIAWDHQVRKTWLFSSGFPELIPGMRLSRAKERLQFAKRWIKPTRSVQRAPFSVMGFGITSTFLPMEYEKAVEKVIEYIRAGDIFEANISQRFMAYAKNCSALELYYALRYYNPAPFAAYLQYQDYALLSASPERFVQCRQGKVQSRPIKGTRPRHRERDQDRSLANELIYNEKERAENVMIVDLMRNDLSRVCAPHSIWVPQLCGLESFATVHHLVSVVEGQLLPDKTAVDVLKATFPGGSITGAPKIRAMEIIAQIEPTIRGPYCGSMGYIAFNGDMDFSITIRTFALNQDKVTFQTGGAVTVDSHPRQEYEETLTKAKALYRALCGDKAKWEECF